MRDETPMTILVAENDADDRTLIEHAVAEILPAARVDFVGDGEQLLTYLRREGPYEKLHAERYPGVVVLDLYMPCMGARAALSQIKQEDKLRRIPVVVLTASADEEDIIHSYGAGVSSFITKPPTRAGLAGMVKDISRYWGTIVVLPSECTVCAA